jgi:hypothetical protein
MHIAAVTRAEEESNKVAAVLLEIHIAAVTRAEEESNKVYKTV